MSKKVKSLEDLLSLLFIENPELEGMPIDIVLDALNKKFDSKIKYRTLALIYEPVLEYDIVYEEEEEENYFEENIENYDRSYY